MKGEQTKVQAAQERCWAKKAAEIAAKREKPPENGVLIERCEVTPKQERALAALISCPTARAAAKAAGLTESTFCRYQKDL